MREFQTVVDAGIDYITATTRGGIESEQLEFLSRSLVQDAINEGNKLNPWGMAGFHGWKAGGVQWGARNEERIIRLSSHHAHHNFKEVTDIAANVSRFDLQATITTQDGPTRTIQQNYKAACRAASKRKKQSTVSVLATNNGTSTVYLGRRVSDRFGRIYDKGSESGLERFRGCVRYEVELKNDVAWSMARAMAQLDECRPACVDYCVTWFRERGTIIPIDVESYQAAIIGCAQQSVHIDPRKPTALADCDRQSRWIAGHVKPTVLSLCGQLGVEAVLSLLGLDQVAQPRITPQDFNSLDEERVH